jgi:ribosome-binding protein aMBF1 (putative translation factor)
MTVQNDTLTEDYAALEDQHDVLAAMLARMESANEERIPGKIVHRLSDGDIPLTVWREHRGLSPEALAEKAGVPVSDVHAIEAGADPRLRVAAALAKALGIDAEDLIPWPQDEDG